MEIKRMWYSDSPLRWWQVVIFFIAFNVAWPVFVVSLFGALWLLAWLLTGEV
jgi:hypothetical protein